jgi:hypothetical protein
VPPYSRFSPFEPAQQVSEPRIYSFERDHGITVKPAGTLSIDVHVFASKFRECRHVPWQRPIWPPVSNTASFLGPQFFGPSWKYLVSRHKLLDIHRTSSTPHRARTYDSSIRTLRAYFDPYLGSAITSCAHRFHPIPGTLMFPL